MKTIILSIILAACVSCETVDHLSRDGMARITYAAGGHDYYTHPDSIDIKGGGYCVRFYDLDAKRHKLFCGNYTITYSN